MTLAKKKIEQLLATVDVIVNGNRPWDLKVYNDQLFSRVISKGSIGLGEAYMDRWWDVEKLDEFFTRIIGGDLPYKLPLNIPTLWLWLKSAILNMQTISRSKKVAKQHYNLGNDLYESFLDPYNQYTCGFFHETEDLDQAQVNKLEMICQKLGLKTSDKVLDIGCGWGGFAKYAASHYGCLVKGISISDEQIKYAKEFCTGLPVQIQKIDYRELAGKFDKVLICGMIEHVGYKNYRTILRKVREVLNKDGLFLLHTIGNKISHKTTDPWIGKYIFPNSMTPSLPQLTRAAEGLFVLEDLHNFGAHYTKTLKAWHENFKANWHSIKDRYDERFYRMWEYYLLSSAGFFAARTGQLWQVVFSPQGEVGGYDRIRQPFMIQDAVEI